MKYNFIQLTQGDPEWIAFRKNHITATDSGIILNLNPWKEPNTLWEEKMELRAPEPENDKMREGKIMEEKAREYFNKKINDFYQPVVLQCTTHPFMMCSLDGMNPLGEILEIKCGKSSHELALKNEIPPYYYAQCQHQIWIADVAKCLYFSYRSDNDNIGFYVYRDEAFIERMIEAEKKFYDCLINFTEPVRIWND